MYHGDTFALVLKICQAILTTLHNGFMISLYYTLRNNIDLNFAIRNWTKIVREFYVTFRSVLIIRL